MAVPLGADPPSSLKCPSCSGVDVTLALQGPTYPVHWCGACHTYFCCPPAAAACAPRVPEPDSPFADEPSERVALALGGLPVGPVWRRAFGDVHAALGWRDGRWQISITDASDRAVILTSAEGALAEAQAKAERLVGYLPTGPWTLSGRPAT